MARPIDEMSNASIDREITNHERLWATLTAAQKERYRALVEARAHRSGFDLDTSLDLIAAAARNRRFLFYKELADASNVDWGRGYFLIGGHLWDLVKWADIRGIPMLSAIVVNKENLATGEMNDETLAGFLRAAEELGRKGVHRGREFLKEEQEAVFSHFVRTGT